MAYHRETIEHMAQDTGLCPKEIDGSSTTGDDRAEHLAADTGVAPQELSDERGGRAAPFAGAVNPD